MISNGKRNGHYLRTGPGGMNCPCCGPAPGKRRTEAKRIQKKRERRDARREIVNILDTEAHDGRE